MSMIFPKARAVRRFPGFLLLFLSFAAHSQNATLPPAKVQSVTLDGALVFSQEELRNRMATSRGDVFSHTQLNADVIALQKYYEDEGYASCRVNVESLDFSRDSSTVDITLGIDAGKRAVLGRISIEGESALESEAVRSALSWSRGEQVRKSTIEEGIQRVLRAYEGRGFPFAKARIERVLVDSSGSVDSIELELKLDEGPSIELTEMRIDGTQTTKSFVIEREVRLSENHLYSEEYATRIKRRIERLQLFSNVSMPELYVTTAGAGGILIRVEEGRSNRFDGILGYVPQGTDGKGYVTGVADVKFGNLFGTARKLSVFWARENQTTQDIRLAYSEPWIGSVPINADVAFGQRKQDSTYLRRSYNLQASYNVTDDFTAGVILETSSVYPSGRVTQTILRSEARSIGGSIRYDLRDDAVTPTRGLLYASSFGIGTKSVSGNGSGSEQVRRLSFDFEGYLSFFPRQVAMLAIRGRDVRSTVLEQSDLIRLGGTSTLRGYRESQFEGSRVVWSNFEYRLLAGGRSLVYGFLDGGYIALPDRPEAGFVKSELARFGYGVGARIDSGIGLFGFSIGFGKGDTFRTAKLHVRVMNEF